MRLGDLQLDQMSGPLSSILSLFNASSDGPFVLRKLVL